MIKILHETRIIRLMIILPIVAVILTSTILTNIFLSAKIESHNNETKKIEQRQLLNLRNKLKERITNLSFLFANTHKIYTEQINNELRDETNFAYKLLENIYTKNKHLSKDKLSLIINNYFSHFDFYKKNNNSLFIYNNKTKEIITLSNNIPKKSLLEKFNLALLDKKEAFLNLENKDINEKKIFFIKKFTRLNLTIVSTTSHNIIREKTISSVVNFAKNTKFIDKSYIFILDKKAKTFLFHKYKFYIDKSFTNFSKKNQKNISDIINNTKNNKGDFITYTLSEKVNNKDILFKKLSYVKEIKNIGLTIGNGLPIQDLKKQIEYRSDILNYDLENSIKTIIIISSIVTIIIIILLLLLSQRIKNLFARYSKKLDSSNQKLKRLNENLENTIEKQVSDLRKKDSILYQQSKMASMGEMIGNIAHQWRQPLSAISTTASGIKVQKEFNLLEDKDLDKGLDSIVENTKTLSQTIDDFRNFFNPKKEKTNFSLTTIFDKTYKLLLPSLKNKDIKIIDNIDDFLIFNYENELIQVLLNILSNAKDQLILKTDIKNKLILINIYKKEKNVIIEIKDNAGGISEEISNRIFEPYFTTKFASNGTGIGLYMTKEIIEKSFHGKIDYEPISLSNNGFKEKGALFKIEFPF